MLALERGAQASGTYSRDCGILCDTPASWFSTRPPWHMDTLNPRQPRLRPGSRIGPYEIEAAIGAGGMGEVYRARDLKLGRAVAIKILPEAIPHDPDRLTRFDREARTLAALNHPHIATIYGVEEDLTRSGAPGLVSASGDAYPPSLALVMELVEGETLADRIAAGPVPLEDALPIARQIADALEAAHEQNVVHRDLKPANIKLTPAGQVKVLDFGLAKALPPDPPGSALSYSPTRSVAATMQGVVLGTAAYMSPEQARGRPVDRSSDLWAFGCVLYEMLTGRRAFLGEDVTEVAASVLKSDPDWTALPVSTPTVVRALLRQCLQKQAQHRMRDARSARLTIESAMTDEAPVMPREWSGSSRPSWTLLVAAAAAATAVGALLAWAVLVSRPPARPAYRSLLLPVAPAERLMGSTLSSRPSRPAFVLSPDGRTIVFIGVQGSVTQLYRSSLEDAGAAPEDRATPLPGTEGARGPFFSPDGRSVGFWAEGMLKRVPIDGGPRVEIGPALGGERYGVWGATWAPDGTIFFAAAVPDGAGRPILRIAAAGGGTGEIVARPDAERSETALQLPHLLPGGRTLLYTAVVSASDEIRTRIIAHRLDTNQRTTLIEGAADARYVSTGHLLYMLRGTLMAARFDPQRLELIGDPVAVLDNVMQAIDAYSTGDATYSGQFAVADNGTLAYLSGGIYPPLQMELVWVDPKGGLTPLQGPHRDYLGPRVSPDGRRIAYTERAGRNGDIWVADLNGEPRIKLTSGGGNLWAAWSPNGGSLVYRRRVAAGFELARIAATGTGTPESIAASEHQPAPGSIWADVLAFVTLRSSLPSQIWTRRLDGAGTPELWLDSAYALSHPAFSPNGKWIAYVSSESGRDEVYVAPYPGPGEKIPISTQGGHSPVWSRTGPDLFYMRPSGDVQQLLAIDIDPVSGHSRGASRVLFEGPYRATTPLPGYDAAPDGRFLMTRPAAVASEPAVTHINVWLNWADELKRVLSVP